ncbi:MAG: tRNA pseudouridine(55) synthase TruB [Planctomycetota bacterium]
MFGILNLYKPSGCTSRDVVNRVQRLVRPVKVGHAGTLDPLATGVLVVCLGPATRLVEHVQRMEKRYRATFLLGRTSQTEDVEGEVTLLEGAAEPTLGEIEAMLPQFVGQIQQRPPAFSAVKLQGKRAYKLARKGQEVEVRPRTVQIFQLSVESYAYPELVLGVRCGSGTYVRSLGRDIAEALGTGAVMSALERTAIGVYRAEDALHRDEVNAETLRTRLLPSQSALPEMPHLQLTEAEVVELQNGRFVDLPVNTPTGEHAAIGPAGVLTALAVHRGDGVLRPVRVFPQPD